MKRYIALDIGDVRIGVARSDIMGIIASPLETINRKKIKSVKRIAEICKENDTNLLVVGIPKSLNGEEKRQAEKVREYIEKSGLHEIFRGSQTFLQQQKQRLAN